jgi:SAM-dependent methyltransferase
MGYLNRLFRKTEEENRAVIMGLLERQPSARFLDLGCGDGDGTLRLAEKIGTPDMHGVEIVAKAAHVARGKGIKVVEADLNCPLPLPAASFDVIHANQVIEHLYDTDCFVSEIRRLLRPGGYAIVSTNNLASLHNIAALLLGRQPPSAHVSNRWLVGNGLRPLDGQARLRVFSYRALREFLAWNGLEPESYRTVGFYPFPSPVARLLGKLLPVYGAMVTCKVRLTAAAVRGDLGRPASWPRAGGAAAMRLRTGPAVAPPVNGDPISLSS